MKWIFYKKEWKDYKGVSYNLKVPKFQQLKILQLTKFIPSWYLLNNSMNFDRKINLSKKKWMDKRKLKIILNLIIRIIIIILQDNIISKTNKNINQIII